MSVSSEMEASRGMPPVGGMGGGAFAEMSTRGLLSGWNN